MTVTCPKPSCADNEEEFANPGALAAHLIDAHGMAGIAALAMARSTVPHEETPMKPCKNCGGDHRSDNKLCPENDGTKRGGGGVSKPERAAKKRK